MTDFKYICSCGCRIDKEDIQIFSWREDGKQKRKKVCPIHPDCEAIERVSVCQKEGCNKEIIFPIKGGGIVQYCPEHAKEHLLEKRRRYARKYWEQSKKKKKKKKKKNFNNIKYQDLNRADCIHRKECMDKYLGYACIPCKNCKKYAKGGFEKDIANQGDYGLMDTSEINFLESAY